MKRMMICLSLCTLVYWTAAAGAAQDSKPEEQVKIDNFSFVPQTLTVKAGTRVTWVNKDEEPHTVVSTTKKFSSRVVDTGGRYDYTFTDPGTYEYYCSVHPHMKAKVIVQ
jgi:plastocyanin